MHLDFSQHYCLLVKATTGWRVRDHFEKNPQTRIQLVTNFLDQYLKNLESASSGSTDSLGKGVNQDIWVERVERLEMLEWIFPAYFLHEQNKLQRFLNPRLDFKTTADKYSASNRLTAEKLRTHIGVLLQVLRKLTEPSVLLSFDKPKLAEIKESIEKQIIGYLRLHVVDKPELAKVDVFSQSKEQGYQTSEKEALLPQIAQAINWFTDKKPVLDAVLASGDINKFLTVLDFVAVERIKDLLIENLLSTDLVALFDEHTMIPDIQTTLVKLSHHPELLEKFEEALQILEERSKNRVHLFEYRNWNYISKLLVAYFKADEAALEAIAVPGPYEGSISELSYDDYKSFYQGLLFMSVNPRMAVAIFNQLAFKFPDHVSIALNRMEAKQILGSSAADYPLLREAYDEWTDFEKTNSSKINQDFIEPELSGITLTILLKLDEHDELEKRFRVLSVPVRLNERILTIRIDSLVAQKRTIEARLLIEIAKSYHQLPDKAPVAFIEKLELMINDDDDFEKMQAFGSIFFNSTPISLIKLLPPVLNGKVDIYEFLIKEITTALDRMLDKIRSIALIKDEDKYNDIVQLALDGRLNTFGFHVSDQSRGGFSATAESTDKKQPGERDLTIIDRSGKRWMVCEALIYRGKSTAEKHLQKVFDYNHQKEAMTILFYDLASTVTTFDHNWKRYMNDILPSTKFPEHMQIESGLDDVSAEYNLHKSSIKIGKTVHGTGTILYHIFVNINYKSIV
jgi:hypothetical protein